jgi:hypothetical protein
MNESDDEDALPIFKTLELSPILSPLLPIPLPVLSPLLPIPLPTILPLSTILPEVVPEEEEIELDDSVLLSTPIKIDDIRNSILYLQSIENETSKVTEMVCGDIVDVREQLLLQRKIATAVQETKAKLISDTITALYTLRYLQHSVDSIHLIPVLYRKQYIIPKKNPQTYVKSLICMLVGVCVGIIVY